MAFKRVTRSLTIKRDIARLLSQATYHRLVLAIREIIANAHDANAPEIHVEVELVVTTSHAIFRPKAEAVHSIGTDAPSEEGVNFRIWTAKDWKRHNVLPK